MDVERLAQLLKDAGYEPEPYSGRGMNGKQCLSVTTGDGQMSALAGIIEGADDGYEAAEIVRRCRVDNMGRDLVLYWPSAPIAKPEV